MIFYWLIIKYEWDDSNLILMQYLITKSKIWFDCDWIISSKWYVLITHSVKFTNEEEDIGCSLFCPLLPFVGLYFGGLFWIFHLPFFGSYCCIIIEGRGRVSDRLIAFVIFWRFQRDTRVVPVDGGVHYGSIDAGNCSCSCSAVVGIYPGCP